MTRYKNPSASNTQNEQNHHRVKQRTHAQSVANPWIKHPPKHEAQQEQIQEPPSGLIEQHQQANSTVAERLPPEQQFHGDRAAKNIAVDELTQREAVLRTRELKADEQFRTRGAILLQSKAELDQLSSNLKQLEANIQARETKVQARETRIQTQEAQLTRQFETNKAAIQRLEEKQGVELISQKEALKAREEALKAREEAVTEQLDNSTNSQQKKLELLDQREAELNKREASLNTRETALAQQLNSSTSSQETIDRREAELKRREAALEAKQADVEKQLINATTTPKPPLEIPNQQADDLQPREQSVDTAFASEKSGEDELIEYLKNKDNLLQQTQEAMAIQSAEMMRLEAKIQTMEADKIDSLTTKAAALSSAAIKEWPAPGDDLDTTNAPKTLADNYGLTPRKLRTSSILLAVVFGSLILFIFGPGWEWYRSAMSSKPQMATSYNKALKAEDAATAKIAAAKQALQQEQLKAAEVARQAEVARLAEEARLVESARLAAEARLLEEARLEKEANREQIQTLLTAAHKNMQAYRLSSPAHDNAIQKFQAILELDPDNQDAKDGLVLVAERYVTLANMEIKKRNLKRASHFLNKASSIHPQLEAIKQARNTLNNSR